jgi:hyperosmotically inducible periplasmic protein
MKSGLIKVAIATVAILGPMAVLADDQGSDADNVAHGTKVYVRDSVITTKVKARLAAEHITSIARIHVDTDANGIVYLSGTAPSQEAIDTAIRLARDTEHVRDVRSDVTVHLNN